MTSKNCNNGMEREVRSFLMARDPSVDRRFRPRPERQVRLFDEIHEEVSESTTSNMESTEEMTAMSLNDSISDFGISDESTLVYLRLRPVEKISGSYKISEAGNVLITVVPADTTSASNNKNMMEKHYSFSDIFVSDMAQKDVFCKCIGDKIAAEENMTVLAYGTSGSGKTYTLLGNNAHPGIIPRALENIFTMYANHIFPSPAIKYVNGVIQILPDELCVFENKVRDNLFRACGDLRAEHDSLQQVIRFDHAFQTGVFEEVSVLIWISFVEIYNEKVYDLLAPPCTTKTGNNMPPPPRQNLKIIKNNGKVFIKGLTSIYVKTGLEALKILKYGLDRLTFGTTHVNTRSSRSHCIFFVDIMKYHANGEVTEISYKFCDLAGSERLDKTGNIGVRLKEAQRINTSLMVLGRCIDAAQRKNSAEMIPVRESKLTMLIQSALFGKEKLAMIVNVTPIDKYYDENLNVLNFSAIAKNIIYKAPVVKQNRTRFSMMLSYVEKDADKNRFAELIEENVFLRNELVRIKEEYELKLENKEKEVRQQAVETLARSRENFDTRLANELALQKRSYELKLATVKRKYEMKIEELHEQYEESNENLSDEIPSKRRTSS